MHDAATTSQNRTAARGELGSGKRDRHDIFDGKSNLHDHIENRLEQIFPETPFCLLHDTCMTKPPFFALSSERHNRDGKLTNRASRVLILAGSQVWDH